MLRPGGVFCVYQYDALQTPLWQPEAEWERVMKRKRELRSQLGLNADQRRWPITRALLEESGAFRFVQEMSLHSVESRDGARLVACPARQYDACSGTDEEDVVLDDCVRPPPVREPVPGGSATASGSASGDAPAHTNSIVADGLSLFGAGASRRRPSAGASCNAGSSHGLVRPLGLCLGCRAGQFGLDLFPLRSPRLSRSQAIDDPRVEARTSLHAHILRRRSERDAAARQSRDSSMAVPSRFRRWERRARGPPLSCSIPHRCSGIRVVSGGGGIRTLEGPNGPKRFSRPPHSTALPPLRSGPRGPVAQGSAAPPNGELMAA